jgi:hypothetical protein
MTTGIHCGTPREARGFFLEKSPFIFGNPYHRPQNALDIRSHQFLIQAQPYFHWQVLLFVACPKSRAVLNSANRYGVVRRRLTQRPHPLRQRQQQRGRSCQLRPTTSPSLGGSKKDSDFPHPVFDSDSD